MGWTDEQREQAERARQWLRRYRWIQADIKSAERTLAELRAMYDRIAQSFGATASSPGGVSNRTANAAEKVLTAEEFLLLKIAEKTEVLREILEAIDRVENGTYRSMLTCYFIDGMIWSEVGEIMRYENIWNMVTPALLAVEIPNKIE